MTLSIGKIALVENLNEKATLNSGVFITRSRNGSYVPKYLFWHLGSSVFFNFIEEISRGSTIVHLYQNDFVNFPIPLPPLPTQRAITAFLDAETARIDGLIKDYEDLIGLLKEKRQTLISRAVTRGLSELVSPDDPEFGAWAKPVKFKDSGVEWIGDIPEGWSESKLKFACTKIIDCPHETPTYDPDGEYCVIRTADIESGRIFTDAMYRLASDEYVERTRRSLVNKGDIAYGREGERWGHAVIVPESGKFCLGQRMMQFCINTENDPEFIMWQLNSTFVYEQGKVDTVGATSPHVNVETISNYILLLPDKLQQKSIASFLDQQSTKIDSLVSESDSVIELLKEHRSALITNAVTGKINVENIA